MFYVLIDFGLSVLLFASMLGAMLFGVRFGKRNRAKADGEVTGSSAVDGAVYALLGLLVAFTFSGAASRFDERRDLIVEEANDIGTAWLRLDLLPPEAQPDLRRLMRDYTQARLQIYKMLPDLEAAREQLQKSQGLQGQIWDAAVTASREPGQSTAAAMLLLPALNAMFDITTTRTMAMMKHPPTAIFVMLYVISVLASLLAGHNMGLSGKVSSLHVIVFPLVLSAAVNLILDLEHPRLGAIAVDDFDQVIEQSLASMEARLQ